MREAALMSAIQAAMQPTVLEEDLWDIASLLPEGCHVTLDTGKGGISFFWPGKLTWHIVEPEQVAMFMEDLEMAMSKAA